METKKRGRTARERAREQRAHAGTRRRTMSDRQATIDVSKMCTHKQSHRDREDGTGAGELSETRRL